MYPVYTLKNECNDCYKCVRECHVKAIKIQDNSASVIDDKCLACGHCVDVCPSGAKRVRNDIDNVKKLFLQNKKVYVSLAPSWSGVYNISKEKMISVLKKLGFEAVSETALGAQAATLTTMRSAYDTACEYSAQLEMQINHQRQSQVTADVIEISSEYTMKEEE